MHPTASNEDGLRGFYIRGPFAVIAKLDAAVAFFAEALRHLGETGTHDERRVKAILILANPVHAVALRGAFPLRGAWVTMAGRGPGRGPRGTGAARRPHGAHRGADR